MHKICIINEDLSGWLTALYCLENPDTQVTLVQKEFKSSEVESIHPEVIKFLSSCDLSLDDWMPATSSTFRYGTGLVRWAYEPTSFAPYIIEPRFIDSERPYHFGYSESGRPWTIIDAFHANIAPYVALMKWLPSRMLAVNNISPIKGKQKLDYDVDRIEKPIHGVHWDSKKMYNCLKEKCLENKRFLFIEDEIRSIQIENKVSSVYTKDSVAIHADYFFDGVGIILNDRYTVEWKPYEFFLNNSIMSFRKDYGDPLVQCVPYSKIDIATRGYIMNLPLHDQNTFHYCYNDDWDEDDIKAELENVSRVWNQEPVIYKFKSGRSVEPCISNVCGIGTTLGNVDPIYGLNHIPTIKMVGLIADNKFSIESDWVKAEFDTLMDELATFSSLLFNLIHYQPTDYWRKTKEVKYPEQLNSIVDIAKNQPIREYELDGIFGFCNHLQRLFGEHHYFELFHGLDSGPSDRYQFYHDIDSKGETFKLHGQGGLDKQNFNFDEISYMAMVLEKWKWNIAKIGKSFPPHWWYLNQWYNDYVMIWSDPSETNERPDPGRGGFIQPSVQELPAGMYMDWSKNL